MAILSGWLFSLDGYSLFARRADRSAVGLQVWSAARIGDRAEDAVGAGCPDEAGEEGGSAAQPAGPEGQAKHLGLFGCSSQL